jgi:hypothetical protein
MRAVTAANYRIDPLYPRVVAAVDAILTTSDVVTPVAVLMHMGLLTAPALNSWRHGRVPHLEGVIQCNLEKASRILRVLRIHAQDLRLRPSETVYCRYGKGPRIRLRFTKFQEPAVEAAYRTHLIRAVPKEGAATALLAGSQPTAGLPVTAVQSTPPTEGTTPPNPGMQRTRCARR